MCKRQFLNNYSKLREKEIAIRKLKFQRKKRKLDEDGIIFLYNTIMIFYLTLFSDLNLFIEKKNIF